jgi:hypothetical protein
VPSETQRSLTAAVSFGKGNCVLEVRCQNWTCAKGMDKVGVGKETKSYATFSEIGLLRKLGRAVVFIKFPSKHMKYGAQLQQLHERLRVETDATNILTLRTNVSVPCAPGSPYVVQRPRWFTVVDANAELTVRARTFAAVLASVPHVRVSLDDAACGECAANGR